jgi:lipopolysaccharide biosynthesis regulator YciM
MRLALSLGNLGDVMIHLKDVDSAIPHLKDALREAKPINAMQPLLRAVMWFGRIFEIQKDYERAVMLWSFVNLHESSDEEIRNETEKMLENIIPCLSTEAFVNAVNASKTAELNALIDDLLDF